MVILCLVPIKLASNKYHMYVGYPRTTITYDDIHSKNKKSRNINLVSIL